MLNPHGVGDLLAQEKVQVGQVELTFVNQLVGKVRYLCLCFRRLSRQSYSCLFLSLLEFLYVCSLFEETFEVTCCCTYRLLANLCICSKTI